MLEQFIIGNYEELKSDYNKLPKEQKKRLPITLFIINVFDKLLTEQLKQNESKKNLFDETNALPQVETEMDTQLD
jgi:hypothetical protein